MRAGRGEPRPTNNMSLRTVYIFATMTLPIGSRSDANDMMLDFSFYFNYFIIIRGWSSHHFLSQVS